MHTLHGSLLSGNAYKLRWLLAELGQSAPPVRWVEVDLLRHGTHTPEFLALNPVGQLPVLETADGRRLAESNAILHFLAAGSPLLPTAAFEQAQLLQWLFFEQTQLEPHLAPARVIVRFQGRPEARAAELLQHVAAAQRALGLLESHLQREPFIAAGRFSIADIALYAYSHLAGEAGIELAAYPNLRRWQQRLAARARHLPMSAPL